MTQKQKIESQLKRYGKVSRNWALRNNISRLGAYALELREEGYNLIGRYQKTGNGFDYVYEDQDFAIWIH